MNKAFNLDYKLNLRGAADRFERIPLGTRISYSRWDQSAHGIHRPYSWFASTWSDGHVDVQNNRKMTPQVFRNNRVKFPKDILLHCSVHQHGRRDVR